MTYEQERERKLLKFVRRHYDYAVEGWVWFAVTIAAFIILAVVVYSLTGNTGP